MGISHELLVRLLRLKLAADMKLLRQIDDEWDKIYRAQSLRWN